MSINPIIDRRGPARLSDADYRELVANLTPSCHIALTTTPRTLGELRALIDGLPPDTRLLDTSGGSPDVTLFYDNRVVCQYVEIGQ